MANFGGEVGEFSIQFNSIQVLQNEGKAKTKDAESRRNEF